MAAARAASALLPGAVQASARAKLALMASTHA
eukprot:CAMPEP_0173408742 /NCGR_PEP_ID=MMETSP1356-20130122/70508_1 /TAXON_ID=77927 ORGANISM="Hemiselmis virescens, Strain PCC157" /NCGR_SAMPLE_ID=MMETSP1356 /ASSEMBLY_ACC=CAM_ASM_000847 /LENGTH=31 /DNA_ID= /DNA_START= /DNA_END= /DNA_ORIENTATION=